MGVPHHVYLIPGFFGFANLGEVVYFGHVLTLLQGELASRGVAAEVLSVPSHPTASLEVRRQDLLRMVRETASRDDGPIHFIGHSTGGLDARSFVSPAQGQEPELARFSSRVRTVVSVATPHAGTPLANAFQGFFGAPFLKLLSLFTVYVLRFGRLPLSAAFRLGGILMKADDQLGWRPTLLDQLFSDLLSDFSAERQAALSRFFTEVGSDASLIPELTPEAMRAFNARTPDHPAVRYGSVVTKARPPSWTTRFASGLNPYAQLTHALYAFLYRRVERMPPEAMPALTTAQSAALAQVYGALPGPRSNDGIVPTRSQLHGALIAALHADHLDAIGHFEDPLTTPPHIDWLLSGSGFRRSQFERAWRQVADFLLAGAPAGTLG